MSTLAAPAPAYAAQRSRFAPGWQIYALFLAFPLWWVLGASEFIWPVLAFPLLLALIAKERFELPRRFGLWALFLAWMLLSAVALDTGERYLAFAYRGALYFSVTILFLYIFNSSERALPTRSIVNAMTLFWVVVVAGGWLGVLFPSVSFGTPVERLMPAALLEVEFVKTLVHPGFAQVQDILGFPVGRPKTFFAYTNGWGATVALLLPFVLLCLRRLESGLKRRALQIALVLSVVPILMSLNRILWLSAAVGLAWVGIRLARRRDVRVPVLAMVPAIGAILLLVTPLGALVQDRIATPHSDEGRYALYGEVIERVKDSPALGYGAPRPSEVKKNLPSAGTQGQLWTVLFSHGVPGAALFVAWFGFVFLQISRGASELALWMSAVVVIFLVQLPYYDLLPMPLHIVAVAAAVALRELARPPAETGELA